MHISETGFNIESLLATKKSECRHCPCVVCSIQTNTYSYAFKTKRGKSVSKPKRKLNVHIYS